LTSLGESMGKAIHVQPHLTLEEIDQRLKTMTAFWRIRRWLVIRHALVDPAPAHAIARRLGLSVFTVRDLIEAYNRHGPVALDTPGHGQRQHAYLSLAEERAFLAPFVEQSRPGHVVTIQQIKTALAAKLGHAVSQSTLSRLLQRHQWRKLVPRPKHPNSSQEEQDVFKKTSNTKLSKC
jgi:transposase